MFAFFKAAKALAQNGHVLVTKIVVLLAFFRRMASTSMLVLSTRGEVEFAELVPCSPPLNAVAVGGALVDPDGRREKIMASRKVGKKERK
jgi:hypothetical protein